MGKHSREFKVKKFDEVFIKSLEESIAQHRLRTLEIPKNGVRAAVAAILKPGARGAEICLIKRSCHPLDRFSGHMALPGGIEEEKDTDMFATAVRETLEEIGLNLKTRGRVAGRIDDEIPAASAKKSERSYLVTPFVCTVASPAPVRIHNEVERVFWMPVCDLKRGAAEKSPEFFCHDQRIWGMTARIIDNLLKVITPQHAEKV